MLLLCWFHPQAMGFIRPILNLCSCWQLLDVLLLYWRAMLAPGAAGGQALSPPRSRCCLQLDEECPLLHHRVFGCQEGDLSLYNARTWINPGLSHCEGEGAVSACPSRERDSGQRRPKGCLTNSFLNPVQPCLFLSTQGGDSSFSRTGSCFLLRRGVLSRVPLLSEQVHTCPEVHCSQPPRCLSCLSPSNPG